MTNFSETDYAGLSEPGSSSTGATDAASTAEKLSARGHQLVEDADDYVRANPIPVVLGALAVGFAIGLLVRSGEPESQATRWQRKLENEGDHLRGLADAIVKSARKNYKKSSKAVSSAVEDAVSAVQDVDVDDYVDPVTSWFKKLFR